LKQIKRKTVNFGVLTKSKTMNIHEEKKTIIERFKQINDKSLINAIKGLLDSAQKDATNRTTLEEYNEELNQADKEIAEGKGVKHTIFKEQVAKW
jgi:hypothetical protein